MRSKRRVLQLKSDEPRQLVILSGKGGTGKTAVAAAFAHLAHAGPVCVPAVMVDADVDAANLELVLEPQVLEQHEFTGGSVAWIDPERCSGCGICEDVCRFAAIQAARDGGAYRADPLACEGCATCYHQCPEEAIRMERQPAGRWFRSHSRYGPLFHARLYPAQENSGKLVSLAKQQARRAAGAEGYPLMIVDGPPGIACPAIAAATGADLALIVGEPSVAGIHDLERALDMTAHFRLRSLVCVNKADLNREGVEKIERSCDARAVELLGCIPFDEAVTGAMVQGHPVTAHQPDSPAAQALAALWERLTDFLDGRPAVASSDTTSPVRS
jgi:MinD superfamily P-loop ATPase